MASKRKPQNQCLSALQINDVAFVGPLTSLKFIEMEQDKPHLWINFSPGSVPGRKMARPPPWQECVFAGHPTARLPVRCPPRQSPAPDGTAQSVFQNRRKGRAGDNADRETPVINLVAVMHWFIALHFQPHQFMTAFRCLTLNRLAPDKIFIVGFQRRGKTDACFKRIGFRADSCSAKIKPASMRSLSRASKPKGAMPYA